MQNVNLKYLDFEKKVYQTLNKYYFTKHEKQYGVAVSGGPDSMLLLNVLSRWANLEGKFLNVFSFDHNLRKESLDEILFVENMSSENGINYISETNLVKSENIDDNNILTLDMKAKAKEILVGLPSNDSKFNKTLQDILGEIDNRLQEVIVRPEISTQ